MTAYWFIVQPISLIAICPAFPFAVVGDINIRSPGSGIYDPGIFLEYPVDPLR